MNYHDRPEISSSQVAAFLADPVAFYHQHVVRDWPKDPPTPSMRFGTAVHRMIELGGPEFVSCSMPEGLVEYNDDRIGMIDRMIEETVENPNRRLKDYQEWKKGLPATAEIVRFGEIERIKRFAEWKRDNAEKQLIKSGELNPFETIWNHLQSNTFTRRYLNRTNNREAEHFWTDDRSGLECRAKFDLIDADILIDWKSMPSIEPRAVQRTICDRNYDVRLAFYLRGIADMQHGTTMTPADCSVVVVAIENQPGYRVQPIEISKDWLAVADERLTEALEKIREFKIENELNSPVIELGMPRWRFDSSFELEV